MLLHQLSLLSRNRDYMPLHAQDRHSYLQSCSFENLGEVSYSASLEVVLGEDKRFLELDLNLVLVCTS